MGRPVKSYLFVGSQRWSRLDQCWATLVALRILWVKLHAHIINLMCVLTYPFEIQFKIVEISKFYGILVNTLWKIPQPFLAAEYIYLHTYNFYYTKDLYCPMCVVDQTQNCNFICRFKMSKVTQNLLSTTIF